MVSRPWLAHVPVSLNRVDDRAVVRGGQFAGHGIFEVFLEVEALAEDYRRHGLGANIPLF